MAYFQTVRIIMAYFHLTVELLLNFLSNEYAYIFYP
jgi:hypothetical protein